MLLAEEAACSAQRGEQVQAAAVPSASPHPNKPPPSPAPYTEQEMPTAEVAAERSFNILSGLC